MVRIRIRLELGLWLGLGLGLRLGLGCEVYSKVFRFFIIHAVSTSFGNQLIESKYNRVSQLLIQLKHARLAHLRIN